MAENRPLPDWPAAMDEEMAAAYLSLSPASLRRYGPKAFSLTPGRVAWRRIDLDQWLAQKAGAAIPSEDIFAHG